MNSKHFHSFAVVFLLSSAANMFAAAPNDSIKSKLPIDSVRMGKELYANSCVRCHKLKEPSKYTIQQWPGLVNKMQKRAKITDNQKAIILSYLLSEAKK